MNPTPRSPATHLAVWIIEDDSGYRNTLAYVLNHTSDLRCTRAFGSFEDVEAWMHGSAADEVPDLVLMDIGLPGIDGIEGTGRMKARLPEVPVVMLTLQDDAALIFRALQAGASGYLLKETAIDDALTAMREAVRGGAFMPAPVAEKVLRFFTSASPKQEYGLTPREREILGLMAEGKPQKVIAGDLALSPHTVDNHLRSIYCKLHVNSNLEAVAKAYRERLI